MAKWSNAKMADLTRKLADTAIDYKQRCEELEAKLAKAVDMLRILQVHPVVLAELNYDERSEKKGQGDD